MNRCKKLLSCHNTQCAQQKFELTHWLTTEQSVHDATPSSCHNHFNSPDIIVGCLSVDSSKGHRRSDTGKVQKETSCDNLHEDNMV